MAASSDIHHTWGNVSLDRASLSGAFGPQPMISVRAFKNGTRYGPQRLGLRTLRWGVVRFLASRLYAREPQFMPG